MKLLLLNPNTTQAVTDAVLVAARAVARPGTELKAVTGRFGPVVIGSRAENALAQHSVLQLAAEHAHDCDAVVLAVSLDTGLWACRELLKVPVTGMTEAGLLAGCSVATRIGLITYGRRMGPLYREIAEGYGLASRLAGIATLDLTPQQTFSEPQAVRDAVLTAARQLVQHEGAEAVLLAGAAMAAMAADLQPEVDVPLLDGVACAVALAEAHVSLKFPKARSGSVSGTGGREVRGVSPELANLFAQRP
ncbi:aspartate/glutamate racemase family protein [Piscinibacter sp. HJYY11]|uniref:aspartate/glutamate racemase family protein n=1 Tax=Piscinibacter sp. HJYY11 TaxID=2801333 RepID=UPI00191FF6C9|nr:aspartate/glutamate racemase family protein [Piscinibacter sp. HJYY11]MBL0730662.1 Asp/Glu/hydantoin racemase [Piscinibacter sp. HJYY11]